MMKVTQEQLDTGLEEILPPSIATMLATYGNLLRVSDLRYQTKQDLKRIRHLGDKRINIVQVALRMFLIEKKSVDEIQIVTNELLGQKASSIPIGKPMFLPGFIKGKSNGEYRVIDSPRPRTPENMNGD